MQQVTPLRSGISPHLRHQRKEDDLPFRHNTESKKNNNNKEFFMMPDFPNQILKQVSTMTISASNANIRATCSISEKEIAKFDTSTPSPTGNKRLRHKRKPSWIDTNCLLLRTPTAGEELLLLSPPPLLIPSVMKQDALLDRQSRNNSFSTGLHKRQRRSIIAHRHKISGGRDNGMSKFLNSANNNDDLSNLRSFDPQIPILDDISTTETTKDNRKIKQDFVTMPTSEGFKPLAFSSMTPPQYINNSADKTTQFPNEVPEFLFAHPLMSNSIQESRNDEFEPIKSIFGYLKIGLTKSSSFSAVVSDSSRSCTPEPENTQDHVETHSPIILMSRMKPSLSDGIRFQRRCTKRRDREHSKSKITITNGIGELYKDLEIPQF